MSFAQHISIYKSSPVANYRAPIRLGAGAMDSYRATGWQTVTSAFHNNTIRRSQRAEPVQAKADAESELQRLT